MSGSFKVGITGTHCSGKSTLVDALVAHEFFEGYPFIKEVAARFPREHRQHLATQFHIMSAQIAEETRQAHFVSDRTVLDNIAYTTLNFEESVANKPNLDLVVTRAKEFFTCLDLERTYIATRPYDLIVFVDEFFPIENDGNRCLNERYQQWIFDFLKGESGVAGALYHIPVLDVSGPTEKRVDLIVKRLKGMSGN